MKENILFGFWILIASLSFMALIGLSVLWFSWITNYVNKKYQADAPKCICREIDYE